MGCARLACGGCAVRGEICALRRAESRGGGLCHTAGDMRAERAEMGCTGAEIEGRYAAGEEIYGQKKHPTARYRHFVVLLIC